MVLRISGSAEPARSLFEQGGRLECVAPMFSGNEALAGVHRPIESRLLVLTPGAEPLVYLIFGRWHRRSQDRSQLKKSIIRARSAGEGVSGASRQRMGDGEPAEIEPEHDLHSHRIRAMSFAAGGCSYLFPSGSVMFCQENHLSFVAAISLFVYFGEL